MRHQAFTYGGNDLSPYMYVTEVTRTIAPERSIATTTVPGMDGELVGGITLDPLDIAVTAFVRRQGLSEVAEARRVLARLLVADEPARLILPDEPDKYYLALYKGGAELSRAAHLPSVELEFHCADPVAYGAHRTASVGTATTAIEAGGTCRAWPTVTAKPPSGSSWTVTNVTTGDFVRVNASFSGSQTVVLDMGLQRCTVNGADHAVSIDSDFFAIDGLTQLKVSEGTATIEWDERWL